MGYAHHCVCGYSLMVVGCWSPFVDCGGGGHLWVALGGGHHWLIVLVGAHRLLLVVVVHVHVVMVTVHGWSCGSLRQWWVVCGWGCGTPHRL